MISEPSEILAVRMCSFSPQHGVHRFCEKLKEVCETLPTQMAFPSLLWSPVSRNKYVGVQSLLLAVSSVCWASICLTFWGNRILFPMPPRTVIYFEWVPDVLRDARWLMRGRPASRKMCPISLDMNHKFKLSGPAQGGGHSGPVLIASVQCGYHLTLGKVLLP